MYRRTETGTKGTHLRLPRSALASWLAVGQACRLTDPTSLLPTPFRQPRRRRPGPVNFTSFVSNSSPIPLLVRANRITAYISVCRIHGNSVNHYESGNPPIIAQSSGSKAAAGWAGRRGVSWISGEATVVVSATFSDKSYAFWRYQPDEKGVSIYFR